MRLSVKQKNLLDLFHHGHHSAGEHEWHHCGGRHKGLGYTIKHCACGRHRINKKSACGHAVGRNLETIIVRIEFIKECPEGGWHMESGIVEAK